MAAALTAAEAWLKPLDRVRTAVFVRALSVAPLRAVLATKRRRIPALLLLHSGAAFVLAVLAPTLLLLAGPLLLGVPHLLSDLRYLALRPSLPRSARSWLLGGAAALLGLRLAALGGWAAPLRYELPLAALWVFGSVSLGATRRRDPRLLFVAVAVVGFAFAAWRAPSALRLSMAHAHNPLALLIWALMFGPARRRALWVCAVVAFGTLLLLGSPLSWLGFQHGVVQSFGLHVLAAADQLAPFAPSAPRALGVVGSFAFLQSVHYAVWLHAIPQEATQSEGTLSFRMSFRALRGELGSVWLGLAALLVVAVPVCGAIAPLRTQSIYLSLATFHGYLELAALGLWWLGRRPVS